MYEPTERASVTGRKCIQFEVLVHDGGYKLYHLRVMDGLSHEETLGCGPRFTRVLQVVSLDIAVIKLIRVLWLAFPD